MWGQSRRLSLLGRQVLGVLHRPAAVSLTLMLAMVSADAAGAADPVPPLQLDSKVPLGDVRGRIDHLAADIGRRRLYVAELGNDTVGVVDLAARKLLRTLSGFREPQGIGYARSADALFVANAADGSVRILSAEDFKPTGQVDLGRDADNVRVDDKSNRVFVGYGSGALAVLDARSHAKQSEITLKDHPESFQLEGAGRQVFVNVPDANQIAVVDRMTMTQTGTWRTADLRGNFPLVIDQKRQRILAVFRHPAKLGAFDMKDGSLLGTTGTCSDSDDVFLDSKRDLVYVICGEGFVDVLAANSAGYSKVARIQTSAGARTGLFVPELDILAIAVRATHDEMAAVWLYHPLP